MKTREELFIEFQKELEKKRKWKFWSLVLLISIVVTVYLMSIFNSYGFVIVCIIPFAFILSILGLGILESLFPDEANYFSIEKLSIKMQLGLMSKRTERNVNYDFLQTAKKRLEKSKSFVDLMRSNELTIITPDPIWLQYIIGLSEMEEEKVKNLQKEFDELENKIYEWEVIIQFYDQVSEKNFCQYFWSFKWLKKIN